MQVSLTLKPVNALMPSPCCEYIRNCVHDCIYILLPLHIPNSKVKISIYSHLSLIVMMLFQRFLTLIFSRVDPFFFWCVYYAINMVNTVRGFGHTLVCLGMR